ncbi:hypothetical protein AKAW_10711 [Aspergillus luchuensis IFO 4308]|nr:hypothetical protein AKAW_10711 [Aspergillus luchuensis IFO 4308]
MAFWRFIICVLEAEGVVNVAMAYTQLTSTSLSCPTFPLSITLAPPEYVFPRDYLDNNRYHSYTYNNISRQSYSDTFCTQTYLQNANLKISDIATGTGIVLTDLSRRLPPSVRLDASDSSLDAFPPKELLPRNIGLPAQMGYENSFPARVGCVSDIVHVRNVVSVLWDEEIVAIVSKLFRILKPGDYFQ